MTKRKSKYADIQPDPDGPQFPFKVTEDMSKEEAAQRAAGCNHVLMHVDPMIYKIIRSKYGNMGEEMVDEIAQLARIHVWQSLPKYDLHRGYLLSTYVYGCINTFGRNYWATVKRQQKISSKINVNDEYYNTNYSAKNEFGDTAIDEIAEDFQANYKQVLSKVDARIYEVYLHSKPEDSNATLAKRSGYKQTNSYSTRLGKVRKAVLNLNLY